MKLMWMITGDENEVLSSVGDTGAGVVAKGGDDNYTVLMR